MLLCILPSFYIVAEEKAENIDWVKLIQNAGTNYDMKMKASEGIKELNSRIDSIIHDAKSVLDEQAHKLLILNQENWIKYSESRASFTADAYRGGTHQGLSYGYAMINLQKLRIVELNEMISEYNSP